LFQLFLRNGTNFTTPLTVFDVEEGKKYRFRIINNAAVFCPIEVHYFCKTSWKGFLCWEFPPLVTLTRERKGVLTNNKAVDSKKVPGLYYYKRFHLKQPKEIIRNSLAAFINARLQLPQE